jgi:hypothetical protein
LPAASSVHGNANNSRMRSVSWSSKTNVDGTTSVGGRSSSSRGDARGVPVWDTAADGYLPSTGVVRQPTLAHEIGVVPTSAQPRFRRGLPELPPDLVGSGSGRLLAVTPRLVEANHLPPVPEQRAHRADRCDGHLPATMTTCAVDGDEKSCASHAVDRQGAGQWTLLQPSLFAENRPSREGGVIARWWEEDGIEREPCRDDNALPCAAVPDGEQDERC